MPSTPADAKGLLKTAIRDDNPVLFFLDIGLLYMPGDVPADERVVPLGRAAVVKEGQDVTLVSYGKTVHHCLQAAEDLRGRGISAEVIDLRSLKPLDEAAILASVTKTGRLVVVHEANRRCGVGAEIAALAAEHAFSALKAPIARLGGPDAPAAASHPLEAAYAPSAEAIATTARRLYSGQ